MTLIALTTQNRCHVSAHAGRCRRFTLARMENGQLQEEPDLVEVDIDHTLHAVHDGLPAPLHGMQVLITGGVGPGLARRLGAQGVQVLVTDLLEPREALQAGSAGVLQPPAQGNASPPHGQTGHACNCHA